MNYAIFISCPKGLEYLLAEEIKALGVQVGRVSPHGVFCDARIQDIYHIALWSRLANRLHLELFSGQIYNEKSIYELCLNFPWQTVFSAEKSIAVSFHGTNSHIRNTMYGAQVVKDGVVDHFSQSLQHRPAVNKENPDILLHAHLKNDVLSVSLDLLGYSMHQRGYRLKAGIAPIKENVAAAMLIRANWPALAEQGYHFYDPFCGSGTIVLEAAMMAAHIAPGLLRKDQAFMNWVGHQPHLWEKIRTLALGAVKPISISVKGSDRDHTMIAIAKENAETAGIKSLVQFEVSLVAQVQNDKDKGLIVTNPPYGERMDVMTQWVATYQELGIVMRERFQNWQAFVLTSESMLAKAVGLRSHKQYHITNGQIPCMLYAFSINEQNTLKHASAEKALSPGAEMLFNRLKKNQQHLAKWRERSGIDAYRLYDADLPEYAFAIDVYGDYAVLQEYKAPASVPEHKIERRRLDVMQVVPKVLGLNPAHVVLKERKRQRGESQYQKINTQRQYIEVREGRVRVKVNLQDYLDTGLFLDHRPMRLKFAELKPGTRFLNCFCYTAVASLHAARAGAYTTNIDMSKTYLGWAQDNFALNGLLNLKHHHFIQEDCLLWLKNATQRFDVIFLDPPSFSNSKRMQGTLDVQRDQRFLVEAAMRLCTQEGVLYFSTNLRSFSLAPEISEAFEVKDISKWSIDKDFERDEKIHRCFEIRHIRRE